MAFKVSGTHDVSFGPILRKNVLNNSLATTVGDAVSISSGVLVAATNATVLLGNIVAHLDANGLPLNTTGAAGAVIGSYAGTFTTASDNTTVAQVVAKLDVSKMTIWEADEDEAVADTTIYTKFVVATKSTIDGSSTSTTGQYVHVGAGSTSTKGLYNIFTSAIFA